MNSRARRTLGVFCGRDALRAAVVDPSRDTHRVRAVFEYPWSLPLFAGSPDSETASMIGEAINQLRTEARITDAQIALPDPVALYRVFHFDQLPKRQQARSSLVEWRLCRELGATPGSQRCATQDLGHYKGKHLLLGIAVDRQWTELVERKFLEAGILVGCTDLDACHVFNHELTTTAGTGGGALIVVRPEYWSLLIWDTSSRFRVLRSVWITNEATAPQAVRAAREIEVTIRGWAANEVGDSVTKLFLMGSGPFADDVTSALNPRLPAPLTVARHDAGFAPSGNPTPDLDGRFGAALTAGVWR